MCKFKQVYSQTCSQWHTFYLSDLLKHLGHLLISFFLLLVLFPIKKNNYWILCMKIEEVLSHLSYLIEEQYIYILIGVELSANSKLGVRIWKTGLVHAYHNLYLSSSMSHLSIWGVYQVFSSLVGSEFLLYCPNSRLLLKIA